MLRRETFFTTGKSKKGLNPKYKAAFSQTVIPHQSSGVLLTSADTNLISWDKSNLLFCKY